MRRDEFTKFDITRVGVGSTPSAAEDVVFAGVEYVGLWVVGCHVDDVMFGWRMTCLFCDDRLRYF